MSKRFILLLASFALVFILPLIGSYIKWHGFPPGYGLFPAQEAVKDPGFNQTAFNMCAAFGLLVLSYLFFPKLWGFKKVDVPVTQKKEVGYPKWFVPSIIVLVISWFFMWGRFSIVQPIDHFTFVPLWWGFIFLLDAIVYKRNNGVSLISSKPVTMKIMAAVSAFSWFVFEYQNFFVLENWYYPNWQVFTNFGNITWQLMSYTTVLPAIFEWYWLLGTFKLFREKYANGPKISFSTNTQYVFLLIAWILLFMMGYFPFQLFWMLWFSLIPALVPAMVIGKYWTPFEPIGKRGDYSSLTLIAIATVLNGFFWEFWNFGSEWFHDDRPTNPNYWRYSVPYVDKYHIFSEMPILGYFGYMFFGIVCWVMWVAIAHLVGFNSSVDAEENTV